MVAALRLVIGMVVLHKPGCILWQRVDDAACTLVCSCLVVFRALPGHGLALLHALLRGVFALEVALDVHLAHVVHRAGDGCLDARVDGSGIDGHTSKAANADDTDALCIYIILHRKKIDGSEEVLGVDVGRSHAPRFAATLSCERGVEGNGEESTLCQMLGIETARLFLHGSKRSTNGNGCQSALSVLGCVHVGSEFDAVTIVEGDLLMVDLLTLGENLVPLLCHLQLCHLFCVLCPSSDKCHQKCQGCDDSSHLLLSLFPVAKLRVSCQQAVTSIKAAITLFAEIAASFLHE